MTIKPRGAGRKLSLYKRDSARFRSVEPRQFVWVSLYTDGDKTDSDQRFLAPRDLAVTLGFRFLPVDTVAQAPLSELRDRMVATSMRSGGSPRLRLLRCLLAPRSTI